MTLQEYVDSLRGKRVAVLGNRREQFAADRPAFG